MLVVVLDVVNFEWDKYRYRSHVVRWKQIQEDMVGSVPAGLEQELDRGHAAALKGPNFPVSVLLADIDAVLAEMTNEESIDHGGMGSTNTETDQETDGRVPNEGSSRSNPES
jgi:hypothetical protein